jgi:hypothetical protein
MMREHEYVQAKLRESEAARRHPERPMDIDPRFRTRPLAPVIRSAGRRVRGVGEALERWGSSRPTRGVPR